jgi:membrane complex biogenesis BtpA family protein
MSDRWTAAVEQGQFLLIGMVHLRPLPGSPAWGGSMAEVVERARADARALNDAGFDGVMVENLGDLPFEPDHLPPAAVAAMAVCAHEVRQELGEAPLMGVNALRNDASAALAVAVATGADFIRVNVHTGSMWTDQGLVQGRACRTLRERRLLAADVAVLADVLVKHAAPTVFVDLGEVARDTVHRGLADGLVVTGSATGARVDPEELAQVSAAVPRHPVLAGSGVAPDSVRYLAPLASGAIVGTFIKVDGKVDAPVDLERARQIVAAREALR